MEPWLAKGKQVLIISSAARSASSHLITQSCYCKKTTDNIHMCGRVAQSRNAVRLGAALLCGNTSSPPTNPIQMNWADNWNLAPGMGSVIFLLDESSASNGSVSINSRISPTTKVWGIVPKSGTPQSPLPLGPNKHFSHLMYNARSETLYEKRTFRDLALKGNTCIWAVDGFFEWADDDKDVIENSSYKQPYYVYRKDKNPLLIAGLWNKVKTGYKSIETDDDETLETFTILTTETCSNLCWLNDRQPVILWDVDSALEWLQCPTESLTQKIARTSTDESGKWLTLHPVHKQMTNQKYREPQSIDAIRVEKVPSVASFLTKQNKPTMMDPHSNNPEIMSKTSPSIDVKDERTPSKPLKRKGTLDSYSFVKKEPSTCNKNTTPLTRDDDTRNKHHHDDLDHSVLSELPKEIVDEVLQNKSSYLQQSYAIKKMKPSSPQKGIQSYFLSKKL